MMGKASSDINSHEIDKKTRNDIFKVMPSIDAKKRKIVSVFPEI